VVSNVNDIYETYLCRLATLTAVALGDDLVEVEVEVVQLLIRGGGRGAAAGQ
jgi:hypothetical protein